MKSGAVSSASKSSPPTQVISSSVNSALVLFLTPLFPKKKNFNKGKYEFTSNNNQFIGINLLCVTTVKITYF